ncbi:MAG: hypothetical protein CFE44_02345 [Burkholderiales bacterium PBB4]|nr:MAG: hypothetical protein CFE44_02345 [Burkholderiales bacterium PBB4]
MVGYLGEDQSKTMAHCIALDLECADICSLAAASIAPGGEHMNVIDALRAKACEACHAMVA